MITQEETWALAILTASVNDTQAELNRRLQARKACIELLEGKYQAKFDEQSGIFIKKESVIVAGSK